MASSGHKSVSEHPVVVIGAGIGGLSSAIDLASRGVPVTVLERASSVGGKMRQVLVGRAAIDSGPTVFTMRWVFEELFAAAGADLCTELSLQPLDILARHAWSEDQRFDLHADIERAADAVGQFAGLAEAKRFKAFSAEARAIYRTLELTFLASQRAGPFELSRRIGLSRPAKLFAIKPFSTLWSGLAKQFHDPRLRQLFGRYATYAGASPFLAPATLMLIAHVERDGVWSIAGGMQRLAEAMRRVAERSGVTFKFDTEVASINIDSNRVSGVATTSGETIAASAVVANCDPSALAMGLFGQPAIRACESVAPQQRSLSAFTWGMTARTSGFALSHHNVFFSRDYRREFEDLFRRRQLPSQPTVYVCAQDRSDDGTLAGSGNERLLVLVNAPADGDRKPLDAEDIAGCTAQTFGLMEECGLSIQPSSDAPVVTTPSDFNRMFPATGGALYGRAPHGWQASFRRPAAATRIPGLYLAGGATHPGAGVPMAALSGRLAAARLTADLHSTRSYRGADISGGTSTGRATTGSSRSR
jgi:1-hydroxycarotenoid 3,4-desaturase